MRCVARTTEAVKIFGFFFELTIIVLAEFSSGNPYFSQNIMVSANSGSMLITSYEHLVVSRNEVTLVSISRSVMFVITGLQLS